MDNPNEQNQQNNNEQYRHVDEYRPFVDAKYLKDTTRKEILSQLEYEIQDAFEETLVASEGYASNALKPSDYLKLAESILTCYEADARSCNVHPAVCVAFANSDDEYEDSNYDTFRNNLLEDIRLHLDENENETL